MPWPTSRCLVAYSNLNEVGRAREDARKAYELREKVSERERFYIEANYYLTRDRRAGEGSEGLRTVAADLPERRRASRGLGFHLREPRKLEKTLEESRETMRLEPNDAGIYGNLAADYHILNRLDEAETVYKQAEERKRGGEAVLGDRYLWLF